ncbi:MAG: hypothetical protein HKN82_16035 [Akkermansiaceae bacterium]|nr:hypothetical protein [Akkermansiaceae bacterium]NNM30337.1 hypothetical protein [Akkermansiaceae bacterium]
MGQPSRLEHLADDLWQLSLEEVRHFQAVASKIVEAKEQIAAAEASAGELQDEAAAGALRELRGYLEDEDLALSGPEAVLLAAFCKHQEGAEALETKGVNIFLDSYGRKPANTTSVVEKLVKRRLMALEDAGLHSHKSYQLTAEGRREAWDLVGRLRRGRGKKRFSVVD